MKIGDVVKVKCERNKSGYIFSSNLSSIEEILIVGFMGTSYVGVFYSDLESCNIPISNDMIIEKIKEDINKANQYFINLTRKYKNTKYVNICFMKGLNPFEIGDVVFFNDTLFKEELKLQNKKYTKKIKDEFYFHNGKIIKIENDFAIISYQNKEIKINCKFLKF